MSNNGFLNGRRLINWTVTVLVKSNREGLPGNFRKFYEEHFDFVWRSLRRLGAAEDCLEDLTQDVFLVAARKLDGFEGRSSVRTWLFGIAGHVVMTHHRTVKRRKRKIRALESVPSPAHGEPLSRHDACHLLTRMLGELDADKREIYVLVELEGVAVTQIAAELEINENTLRSRLRAARRQMLALAKRVLREERRHS